MSKKIIQYYLLKKIFNLFVENQDQRYVLVKKNSNFPNLKTGSDLDLLVDDLSLFVRTVEDYFSKKIHGGDSCFKMPINRLVVRKNQ